jgi:hypothetical protein
VNSSWPLAVEEFEKFLSDAGLVLQRRVEDQAVFGNKFLQYCNSDLIIRVISDRETWFVQLAEVAQPGKWYDAERISDILFGNHQTPMFTRQIELFESQWSAIVDLFSVERQQHTRQQLSVLGRKRARRLFPDQ